jgi:hypothetical protein
VLPQTKFLSDKAIGTVVSAGIKLMVLSFIIAVTNPVLSDALLRARDQGERALERTADDGRHRVLSWHSPRLATETLPELLGEQLAAMSDLRVRTCTFRRALLLGHGDRR